MNYADHYTRLIARARGRALEGYTERHHVIPRCMGGDDTAENIVLLTAEEHYVAHQLLAKMNPGVTGLIFAAVQMAKRCRGNKAYGWLRKRHADAMSDLNRGRKQPPLSPESRAKLSASLRGRTLSAEHRASLSAAMRGKKCKPYSDERKANQRRTFSPELRARISETMRLRWKERKEANAAQNK